MDETPPVADATQTTNAPAAPLSESEATQAIRDSLGDSVVPDRILARDEAATVTPEASIEETPVVETPEPVNETVTPTQVQAPAEDVPAEEESPEYIPPVQQMSPIDPKAFVDENGYVDVKQLTDAINSTIANVQQTATTAAQRELAANRAEERQWNSAFDKYPELKSDRTLRDFVQQARIGKATEAYRTAGNDQARLAAVKIPTPTQIASELFKRIGQAKTEGVQAATETTTVAQSNVPLTSGQPAPTTSKNEDLFQKARDPRDKVGAETAQRELLKNLLFQDQ